MATPVAQAPSPHPLPASATAVAPPPAGQAVIEMTGVTKTFDSTKVIDNLHLHVAGRQIFGLIGPSGCGKTTTVRMLVGLLAPTSGSVSVMGVDPRAYTTRDRERIGYTAQGFYLYPTLTVAENARFVAGLYGVGWLRRRRRIPEVLKFLELWEARKRLARDISGGMQRRLALACALLHEPRLLFVDEPTSGLDPMLRGKIWDHLRDLRDGGTTVFVTTQYIDEAAYCDTVSIMNEGKLVASGTPDELRRRTFGGEMVDVEGEGFTRDAVAALWALSSTLDVTRVGPRRLRLMVPAAATAIPLITGELQRHGARVASVEPHVPTFDEVFMRIVSGDA